MRATEPSRPSTTWSPPLVRQNLGVRDQGLRPGNVIDGNPGGGEADRGKDRCQRGHERKVRRDIQSACLAGRETHLADVDLAIPIRVGPGEKDGAAVR